MFWIISSILLVLCALGLLSSYTMGGFIHVLLVIVLGVALLRIIQGGRISSVNAVTSSDNQEGVSK